MNNSLNSPTAMVTYSMSADEFEAFAERKKQELIRNKVVEVLNESKIRIE